MFKRILIATDGSQLALRAVDGGLELAKSLGAEVVFVAVTEHWSMLEMTVDARLGSPDPMTRYEQLAAAAADRALGAACERAARAGMVVERCHVADRYPAEGIVAAAGEQGCDLIVMASHGRRGVRRLLLGSVANEVVCTAAVPVLVFR